MGLDHIDVLIVVISATVGFFLLATFSLSFLIAYQKRYHHHQKEIAEVKDKYEKEIIKSELEIKEQILRNISQEIHDNLGQVFSLANLLLSSLEVDNDPEGKDKVENVMQLISRGINDLKDLSKTLDSDMLAGQGLFGAIKYEFQMLQKTNKYKIEFVTEGTERRFDYSNEIVIYRIVQECLNNIIKHAKASTIGVVLIYGVEKFVLTIYDDGIGFNPLYLKEIKYMGAGLNNINKRAKLIGADVFIDSIENGGTRITVEKYF